MTSKQELYCRIFAVKQNAYQSALDAGYGHAMASAKAYQWVGKTRSASKYPEMYDYCMQIREAHQKKIVKKTNIDAAYIKSKIQPIIDADIRDYLKFDGKKMVFKSFDELTDAQALAIEGIKEGRHGIELKLHGKSWAADMLNKHTGFYEEDNKQKEGKTKVLIEMPDNGRGRLVPNETQNEK